MIDAKGQNATKNKNYALSNFCGFLILLAISCFYFESLGITLINQVPTAESQMGQAGRIIELSDIVIAMFILFIVFTFVNQTEIHIINNDNKALIKSYIPRYTILIAIGLIISLINNITKISKGFDFNIFSVIGISGLYSLFFVLLKDKYKLITGIGIIVIYQFFLLIPWIQNYVSSYNYGGFIGAVALSGYLLILMFLSSVYKKDLLQFVFCLIVFVGIFFLLFIIDIITTTLRLDIEFFAGDKSRLTIYYLLICLVFSSAVFLFFARLTKNIKIPILSWYGSNGVIMFVFADVIVRALGLLTKQIVPVNGDYWFYQVFPIGIIIVAALSVLLAYLLNKFKITDKLTNKLTKNSFCFTL